MRVPSSLELTNRILAQERRLYAFYNQLVAEVRPRYLRRAENLRLLQYRQLIPNG